MIELRDHADGCTLNVHVTPGARRASIGGEHGGALRVSVTAAAEKGKANRAVEEALAEALGIARSAVEVIQGDTHRRKTVMIRGLDADHVRSLLQIS